MPSALHPSLIKEFDIVQRCAAAGCSSLFSLDFWWWWLDQDLSLSLILAFLAF
jgi:hypothetical protein